MTNRKKFAGGVARVFVSLLFCLSPLTLDVRGQQSGRGAVAGTVRDASGASVAEAQVFLISVQQAVLSMGRRAALLCVSDEDKAIALSQILVARAERQGLVQEEEEELVSEDDT